MKYKIFTSFVLPLLLINLKSFSQYEGPNNPSAAQNSSNGCLGCPGSEWNNPINVQYSDLTYASVSLNSYPNCLMSTCYYSRYLLVSDFGFAIPANATIIGVKAEVLRKTDAAYGVNDSIIRIFTMNSPSGDNKAASVNWPTSPLTATYGGENDTWGLDLLPDSINQSSFGLAMMVMHQNSAVKSLMAYVDNVQLTVYYNIGLGIQLQTREASLIRVTYNPVEHVLNVSGFGEQMVGALHVVNLLGKVIYTSPPIHLISEAHKINLPQMAKGIYFAVYNENGKPMTKKFFVE